jgi:hypothetical protein
MKNSTQSGIGTSVRRSVSILMIFAALALANVAKAADSKNTLSNSGTSMGSTNSTISEPASNGSQPDAGASRVEGNRHNFTAQTALYCFTDYGTFYMRDWVPVGSLCQVQLPYYPFYVVYGIAG